MIGHCQHGERIFGDEPGCDTSGIGGEGGDGDRTIRWCRFAQPPATGCDASGIREPRGAITPHILRNVTPLLLFPFFHHSFVLLGKLD